MSSSLRILAATLAALLPFSFGTSTSTSNNHISSLDITIRSSPALPTNCTSPPLHSCAFYADCLEPVFQCGPSGYPIGFGEKFCTKFSLPSNVEKLSAKGQQWMYDTMHCLQESLVPTLEEAAADPKPGNMKDACDKLEKEAFATHAPCYLSSGLCTLGPKDWIAIVDIIGLKTLFGSWDAFEGSVEAAEGCLEFYAWVLENKAVAWVEKGLGLIGLFGK